MSPHLPVTPDEIAEQAIGAAKAGAAILHLHARNPQTGRPSAAVADYMAFLPAIKRRHGCGDQHDDRRQRGDDAGGAAGRRRSRRSRKCARSTWGR